MKKENTAPTTAQWTELYEVAVNLKELAPWDVLWDTDLFTIQLPGQEEPVFVSVMGRNGECYGIGVYPGFRSLEGLDRLLNSDETNFLVNPLTFQNCLMCYFGNREELVPKEREIIKSLGYKFRGRNNWIYFRAMEEGYYPWFLTAEQVDLMTEALRNFKIAFLQFVKDNIEVDFEGGQTFAREYSPERDKWLNTVIPFPGIPEKTLILKFSDELQLQRLKTAKKIRTSVDLDIIFVPVPVQEKPDERPYFPRILVMIDRTSGVVINQNIIDNTITPQDAACNILEDYIKTHGKPAKLFVRDKYFMRYVESFCEQVEITAVHSKAMPMLDEFAEQMMNFMG